MSSFRSALLVVLGVAVFSSACASSSSTDELGGQQISPEEVADRIDFDIVEAEESPVFHAVAGFHDPRDGYARDLLARSCLEGVIEYRAEMVEGTPFENQRTGQPIFNEEIARRWGYSASRLNPAGGFAALRV